ncbi:protein DUF1351 [Candidatus Termititenax aidoneus]|uniref:Protein DUF1351 n=1 Tax=Termititenax aidoneus TaxID=2218524 RepID=A0A388TDB0_TERA1|nr:protein DUF1351 [Candidatus Termititenax aidoneus]
MAENSLTLVVTDEALLKEVTFNYEQLKNALSARLEKYNKLVVTEDAINAAKTDRAGLNKLEKSLADKQKEIQQKLLGGFDTKLKELRGMVSEASGSIDSQVKKFEQIEKDAKKADIESIYADNVGELSALLPFGRLFQASWLNKTAKIAAIEKELLEKIEMVRKDLTVIDSLKVDPDIAVAVKDFYLETLNLSQALARKSYLEQQKVNLAALKAKTDIQNATAGQSEPIQKLGAALQDVIQDAADAVQLEQIDFRIWVTPEQKLSVKEFLQTNKIKYGKVE